MQVVTDERDGLDLFVSTVSHVSSFTPTLAANLGSILIPGPQWMMMVRLQALFNNFISVY